MNVQDPVREATVLRHEGLGTAVVHHARTTPHKPALSDSRTAMTYGELDHFSAYFATSVVGRRCRPGDRVVTLTDRRAIVVASIVGTFRSGCIHVPLDPQMPASRLRYILDEISPALVITETDMRDTVVGHLPPAAEVLVVDDLDRLLVESVGADRTPPDACASDDSAAYCIFTSGSTGRPKGVVIDHHSIPRFFEGTQEVYDVTADSVCASFSPLHFDVFLMDMLFPLAEGAEVHIHDDLVVPDLLFATIRDNDVTHLSAWGLMLGLIAQATDFGSASLPHLQTVLTGTDVPDVKTVQRWLAKNSDVRVINAYGPTEATCASTAHVIREIEPDRQELYPIGQPLRHVRTFLVDEDGERIDALGVRGELLVGGVQVMRSYWNQPSETAAALTVFEGVRCYRTGDICSFLPDGSLFYHGRRDNEVNIGGYRIHLNEIQRVIGTVPHVHASEIVVLESKYDEKVLAAGVLLERGRSGEVDQHVEVIRRVLAEELQNYMIPRHVVVLERFPQLSSGKPDRAALATIIHQQINGVRR